MLACVKHNLRETTPALHPCL